MREQGMRAVGWFMPAEWCRHAATWMVWPHNKALWENGWGVTLSQVQQDFARVVNAIARFEPVNLVVDPAAQAEARALCGDGVRFIPLPVDDSWCRDSGPTFICHPELGTAGISWRFNAWGEGTLITTESVLLNSNRNPGMTKVEIERIFSRLLGIEKTIWLPGDPDHVTGDMTDGHVDGVCAFSRPGHLLVDATLDGHSTYGRVVRENRRALALATDARGRSFECLELFEASEAVDAEAEVFCASYTNFYIANGAIIMPAYGVGADEAAGEVLRRAFPNRQLVPVRINQLAHGGGGIHCITQQQPAWPVQG